VSRTLGHAKHSIRRRSRWSACSCAFLFALASHQHATFLPRQCIGVAPLRVAWNPGIPCPVRSGPDVDKLFEGVHGRVDDVFTVYLMHFRMPSGARGTHMWRARLPPRQQATPSEQREFKLGRFHPRSAPQRRCSSASSVFTASHSATRLVLLIRPMRPSPNPSPRAERRVGLARPMLWTHRARAHR